MIKLKKLLKESIWGERKFGEPLPTMKDYKEAYNKKNGKDGKLNEATKTYKGTFEYDPNDPYKAGHAFEELFDGADHGYSESWDSYDWNDDGNWNKAVEEYHKEMFKIVDGYLAAKKKADSFYKTKEKIFNKWRKTDKSKAG